MEGVGRVFFGKEEMEEFLRLSVRRGWPLRSLAAAPAPERRAVLGAYLLHTGRGRTPEDAARSFLSGSGSFINARPVEFLAWAGAAGPLDVVPGDGLSEESLALAVLAADRERGKRREEAVSRLQARNRAVNSRAAPMDAGVDEAFMREALREAALAMEADEVPVGAVVVMDGGIVGRGRNSPVSLCDPTAHAEVLAMRDAALRVGNYRLTGATIYVTLEPCPMCLGALAQARVARIVYGAPDPVAGAVAGPAGLVLGKCLRRKFLVTPGVLSDESSGLLKSFFTARRSAPGGG